MNGENGRRPVIDETEETTRGIAWLRDQSVAIGLSALNSRALVWVASIGAGAMWTVTILDPTRLRIATAVGYCLTVLAPILWRDTRAG